MANVTWTLVNGTPGSWSLGADWNTQNVPVAGNSVFINKSTTQNYTVTLDISEPTTGG